MIIACPSCSSPYQLRDKDVASLVQVECPSCDSRVILDFEAANDPSLVEAGTQTTNSYADEAAYFSHSGALAAAAPAPKPAAPISRPPAAVPKPAAPISRPAAAAPGFAAPKPAPPAPRPVAAPPAPAPRPVARPAAAAPAPQPKAQPTAARASASSTGPKKTIAMMGGTPVSLRPAEAPAELEPAHEAVPLELDLPVEPEGGDATVSQAQMMADAVEAAAEESTRRNPPHTPISSPSTVNPEAEGGQSLFNLEDSAAAESRADLHAPLDVEMAASPSPKPEKKESSLGRVALLLIIFIIGGALALVAVAFVQNGDPNPLPLIDQLLIKIEEAAKQL